MHAFAATEKCAQQWWPSAIAAFGSGAHSWPTKPDLPPTPRASTEGGEGTGSLQGSASGLCRQQPLCPRLLGKRPWKLSRASFKVACALQLHIMEEMGTRPTAAKLRLGPGSCEAPPVLCREMRATLGNIIKRFPIKSFLYFIASYSKYL